MKYVFDSDHVLTIKAADKANPQKIGEALEKVSAQSSGRLEPKAVVDAARDRKSVLHRHFEWRDEVAAEQYRLDQARSLIRSIHVESVDAESGVARAFLSVHEKSGTAYRSLGDVLASADLQARVLARAEQDLLAFESRYRSLEDVCGIIRQARERLSERRSKHESRPAA